MKTTTAHLTRFALLFAILLAFTADRSVAQTPSDPLSQMEIAFEGNHSKAEIKAKLDKTMELYKLPKTQENYSRAGSALVTLRREIGPTEMAILDHMIKSHVPGVNMFFPDAASLSAAFLKAGDE